MHDQFFIDINHPILKNHNVYGQDLLPGLAYIDLIYQFFREHGYDYRTLHLHSLSILQPLLAHPDTPLLLRLQATQTSPEHWSLLLEGQPQAELAADGSWHRYLTAHIQQGPPVLFEQHLEAHSLKQTA